MEPRKHYNDKHIKGQLFITVHSPTSTFSLLCAQFQGFALENNRLKHDARLYSRLTSKTISKLQFSTITASQKRYALSVIKFGFSQIMYIIDSLQTLTSPHSPSLIDVSLLQAGLSKPGQFYIHYGSVIVKVQYC